MRKLHTILLGVICLCATSPIFSQGNPEDALAKEAAKLYHAANVDAFFTWFTSPSFANILLFLLFLSASYFIAMLALFLLVNKEVIRVKENALVQILLEDWLAEKEQVLHPSPEKIKETSDENILVETINQLDLPNLDILNMETESAKMITG